jgi:hypothetical protein
VSDGFAIALGVAAAVLLALAAIALSEYLRLREGPRRAWFLRMQLRPAIFGAMVALGIVLGLAMALVGGT